MAVDVEIQIQQLFQRNRTDTCCISICPVVSMTQIKIQGWNYSRKKSSVKAMIIERNNYLNQLLDYQNWQPTRDEKDSS